MEVDGGDSSGDGGNHQDEGQMVYEGVGASMSSKLKVILQFGKELHHLSLQLKQKHGTDEKNRKMLEDAFSLLAYSEPAASPVGWQLNPCERENVCQQLNNAIVVSEMGGSNHRPPLETIIKHSKALLRLNNQCGAWLLDQL